MEIGREFSSYTEFATVLKDYERSRFCNYTTIDSTSVERARTKQPRRVFR